MGLLCGALLDHIPSQGGRYVQELTAKVERRGRRLSGKVKGLGHNKCRGTVAATRAETDDRKGKHACDAGELSNRDKSFRSVAVIFFAVIYFDALPMAHMPVDDRGDVYSHTFTYSHWYHHQLARGELCNNRLLPATGTKFRRDEVWGKGRGWWSQG